MFDVNIIDQSHFSQQTILSSKEKMAIDELRSKIDRICKDIIALNGKNDKIEEKYEKTQDVRLKNYYFKKLEYNDEEIKRAEIEKIDLEDQLDAIFKRNGKKAVGAGEKVIEGATVGFRNEHPEISFDNVKDPALFFTGRLEELKTIENLFKKNRFVAIVGLGGIGKTQLARSFAKEHKSQYKIILSVDAKDEISFKMGFDYLRLLQPRSLDPYFVEYANIPTLILIDNLDKPEIINVVKDYLERLPKCWHFLITSRVIQTPVAFNSGELLLTKGLENHEAADYLMEYTKENNLYAAQKIAERLQNFPLALSHAASFMRSRKVSMNEYLKRLRTLQVLGQKISIPGDYNCTIFQAWQASLDDIKEKNGFAIQLIQYISNCAENKFHRSFFERWLEEFHSEHLDDCRIKSLEVLLEYSLVQLFDEKAEIYTIQPLLQEAIKDELVRP